MTDSGTGDGDPLSGATWLRTLICIKVAGPYVYQLR
ncbi:hypothetical protein J2X88_005082 [Pseudomonas extremaustralis]|nr:hypothetical protein [Pseudomonas extremaustralis]